MGDEPLQTYAPRPDRLAAVLAYSADRAEYLDMRQSVQNVAAAYDIGRPLTPDELDERADALISAVHEAAARTLARRLATPAMQSAFASALAAMVLP